MRSVSAGLISLVGLLCWTAPCRAQSSQRLRCRPSPCANRGFCVEIRSTGSFACLCPRGWEGRLCDRRKAQPSSGREAARSRGSEASRGEGLRAESRQLNRPLAQSVSRRGEPGGGLAERAFGQGQPSRGVDARRGPRRNPCSPSPCLNGGECQRVVVGSSGAGSLGAFRCRCGLGWAGERCETSECSPHFCAHGGTCFQGRDRRLACLCPAQFTGQRCQDDVDECLSEPCGPNALRCVNVAGGPAASERLGYRCECRRGWMGRHCHRPCRDIYKSCERWGREQSCRAVRSQTRFFDDNCALSCDVCSAALRDDPVPPPAAVPLPPVLEPLAFLVGRWRNVHSQPHWYPTDFPDVADRFVEELSVLPAEVTMFGTPSLNFSSTARGLDDPSDVREMKGFLTLKPSAQKLLDAALMCTGNEGLTTIEKGLLGQEVLYLNMTYMQIHPSMPLHHLPLGGTRLFRALGPDRLEMRVKKLSRFNFLREFTKVFTRVQPSFDFL